jgi:two-component system phosphate regulon response regulator PhoB
MLPLVYIVESNSKTANRLRRLFDGGRYRALVFSGSAAVVASAEKSPPAIFLVNVQLTSGSGLALCLNLRQHKTLSHVPIMLMSEQDSEEERVLGLELGADDFVSTHFQPRELTARIHAVLRRAVPIRALWKVQSGAVELDTEHFVLSVEGRKIIVTPTQVRLVEYLMRNEGRVFTRDQILEAVWSDTPFVTPRTIDVHIRKLREMIEPDPANPRYLKTVRGAGYYFATQDQPLPMDADESSLPQIPLEMTFTNRLAPVTVQTRLRSAS